MPRYFPVDTLTMKVQEARPFRRFTFSVVEMAVVTAIVLRVYRALVLSLAGSNVMLLGLSFAVGFVVLFGMVTLHLGNFTVRRWALRAPLFAALEAGFESIVSLGLIALHREPLGSTRATFDDWPGIVLSIFTWRVGSIVVFALVLAAAVQLTRIALGEERPDVRHGTGENPA
jgi:hypothetical protein